MDEPTGPKQKWTKAKMENIVRDPDTTDGNKSLTQMKTNHAEEKKENLFVSNINKK